MSASSNKGKDAAPATIPKGVKFLFGGSAGMAATLFVQPLDLVKNRMQLSVERYGFTLPECIQKDGNGIANSVDPDQTAPRSSLFWVYTVCSDLSVPILRTFMVRVVEKGPQTSLHAIRHIVNNEGLFALYTGLSAGLLRQALYTTTRLGIYTNLFEYVQRDGKPPNFAMKATIGLTAGAIGAFVGTPAEISLIRMTADGRLPPAERRGYSSVFNALSRMAKEEGVLTLWRGCIPTIGRAMVVNAAQLASYSQAKELLMKTGWFHEGIFLHFCASMISGLVTTAASMPVDIAKTRIQNMKVIDGKPEYKGALDVLYKVVRKEGFFSLWKGFTPYYARLGPHTVLTFIFLEQMNKFYKVYVLKDTSGKGGGGL